MSDWGLSKLLAWTSPSYPTGGFSYSRGLEWAVESGTVGGVKELIDYVTAILTRGSAWVDAVLFVHAWQSLNSLAALDELSARAAAFRGSVETSLESCQQGKSFLEVTRKAWPHPALEAFATRNSGAALSHSVAVAISCAAHGIDLLPALFSYLHSVAANLVSAGTRLIPLGQTDGQIAIARLVPVVSQVCAEAQGTALDDLGTAAPLVELCSLRHETQYTRLFRS